MRWLRSASSRWSRSRAFSPTAWATCCDTVPGVSLQDRGDDPSTAGEHSRLAGFRPRGRRRRRRATELPAHRPQRERRVLPRSGADRRHRHRPRTRRPTSTAPARSAAWFRSAPRISRMSCVPASAGASMSAAWADRTRRAAWRRPSAAFVSIPTSICSAAFVYSQQLELQGRQRTEIGNTKPNVVGRAVGKLTTRPCGRPPGQVRRHLPGLRLHIGQPNRGPTTTAAPAAAIAGTSIYDSTVKNYNTARWNWRYNKPGRQICSTGMRRFTGNRTESDQVKTYNTAITTGWRHLCARVRRATRSPAASATRAAICSIRSASTSTTRRASITATGAMRSPMAVDAFQDEVSTFDRQRQLERRRRPAAGASSPAPSCRWKSNYPTWFEVISAVRYDNYRAVIGDRLHRAATGSRRRSRSALRRCRLHALCQLRRGLPRAVDHRDADHRLACDWRRTRQGDTFTCADGSRGFFCFLPNPHLRPEVGKNKEVGLNLKKNDLFTQGDSVPRQVQRLPQRYRRLHRRRVRRSSDLGPAFGRSTSTSSTRTSRRRRIEGFEAETFYDAGHWFVGACRQPSCEGENVQTGVGLVNVQPRKITTTAGVRLLEQPADRCRRSGLRSPANTDIPATYPAGTSVRSRQLLSGLQADTGHHAQLLGR